MKRKHDGDDEDGNCNKKIKLEKECLICKEEKEDLIRLEDCKCNYTYCKECLFTWYKNVDIGEHKCLMCMQPLTNKKIIEMYDFTDKQIYSDNEIISIMLRGVEIFEKFTILLNLKITTSIFKLAIKSNDVKIVRFVYYMLINYAHIYLDHVYTELAVNNYEILYFLFMKGFCISNKLMKLALKNNNYPIVSFLYNKVTFTKSDFKLAINQYIKYKDFSILLLIMSYDNVKNFLYRNFLDHKKLLSDIDFLVLLTSRFYEFTDKDIENSIKYDLNDTIIYFYVNRELFKLSPKINNILELKYNNIMIDYDIYKKVIFFKRGEIYEETLKEYKEYKERKKNNEKKQLPRFLLNISERYTRNPFSFY